MRLFYHKIKMCNYYNLLYTNRWYMWTLLTMKYNTKQKLYGCFEYLNSRIPCIFFIRNLNWITILLTYEKESSVVSFFLLPHFLINVTSMLEPFLIWVKSQSYGLVTNISDLLKYYFTIFYIHLVFNIIASYLPKIILNNWSIGTSKCSSQF